MKPDRCGICRRLLNVADNPMSEDIGGDCWGCIGLIEADGGWEPSRELVGKEIAEGWRFPDGRPKPAIEDEEAQKVNVLARVIEAARGVRRLRWRKD